MSPAKERRSEIDKQCPDEIVINLHLIVENMENDKEELNVKIEESNNVLYSVYVPSGSNYDSQEDTIYKNKNDALLCLKQHKKARFKTFNSYVDALFFSKFGDVSPVSAVKDGNTSRSKSPDLQVTIQNHEKSLYKSPKVQDMIKFRKVIESGDIKEVIRLVEENPRYLVSSGDTPSILQEGPRYNALHVASRFDIPEVAKYILEIVSTGMLINKIYGSNENKSQSNVKAEVLLDLYLNTPDKSLNETPLHFASKIGSVAVVQVLILYPQCDRYRRNKFGLTPLDIVCTRASGELLKNKDAIITTLNENYYIPVLRSLDSSLQPTIGNPMTVSHDPELTTTNGKCSPVSPNLRVHALAGPMSEERARVFRKIWKSPTTTDHPSLRKIRPSLFDYDKGLERIGRTLAAEFNVQWKEYWSFLDAFIDLKSDEGLDMLENYLKQKFEKASQTETVDSTKPCSEYLTFHQRLLPADLENNSTAALGLPAFCLENFLKIIARRIYYAILRIQMINNEVCHLQNFINSCYLDKRFESVELNKVHHRIAQLIETNFETNDERDKFLSKVISVHKMMYYFEIAYETYDFGKQQKANSVRMASLCILQYLIDNKQTISENSPEDLQNSLFKCESCHCELAPNQGRNRNKHIKKRLIFSSEVDDVSSELEKLSLGDSCKINVMDYTYMDTATPTSGDEDESDDEFITPPSSPLQISEESSVSSSSDEEFFDTHCVYEVYLGGDKATKLDASVLQAISSVKIPFSKYPFINFWKLSCEKLSKEVKQENWPSPRIKLGPSSKFIKDILSPPSIR